MAKVLKPFEIQDTTTQGASKAYHIGRQRFRFHLVQPGRAKVGAALQQNKLKSSKIDVSTTKNAGALP